MNVTSLIQLICIKDKKEEATNAYRADLLEWGQDPLKHTFGWLHPEYNLMSWALSCLSLREHYDEVALYTDSEGKRILIDKLRFPLWPRRG